jgi:uncharacterized membrane protein YraQ (UPF0718 family)
VIDAVVRALAMALAMGWEILWPLILGFGLSAVVQAAVSHSEVARLLPDDRPRSIGTALALGAASSSCSYAAVALARSIFRKGANFTAAMAFEMASANLVLELSIIMIVLLGWQLTLAELIGAPIMVVLLVLLFRRFLTPHLLAEARKQAERGIAGRTEGHAVLDMSVTVGGSLWRRIKSETVLGKPPSAELRENQKDTDALPPYELLDPILQRLIEGEQSVAEVVAAGFDRETVLRVARLVDLAEYKRRQAAPGVKVTSRNFGRDRRYPITNSFRDRGEPLPAPDSTPPVLVASTQAFDF